MKNLPKGLDATYERILRSIAPEYQRQVESALRWLAFAVAPLSPEELAGALVLDADRSKPSDEEKRLFKPEHVLNYLGGLFIQVKTQISLHSDSESNDYEEDLFRSEVRFAHFSVKEYLCSTRMNIDMFSTAEQTAHLYLAKSFLAYHLQASENTLATEDNTEQFKLWRYAAENWGFHLEEISRLSWTPDVIDLATSALALKS